LKRNPSPKGGDNHEAFYNSESRSLWEWPLASVPGMTLNYPSHSAPGSAGGEN